MTPPTPTPQVLSVIQAGRTPIAATTPTSAYSQRSSLSAERDPWASSQQQQQQQAPATPASATATAAAAQYATYHHHSSSSLTLASAPPLTTGPAPWTAANAVIDMHSVPLPPAGSSAPRADDRIQGWRDVWAAVKMTWRTQRAHLFAVWIHAPIGIVLILLCVWAMNLAIDPLPFDFPAAAATMLLLFLLLLFLDFLSSCFPSRKARAAAAAAALAKDVDDADEKALELAHDEAELQSEKRRFLDPIMALLAPPCDFLLRNMSILFTTNFVMLPTRDKRPAKEIALIVVWFFVTVFLAMAFPAGFLGGADWAIRRTKRVLSKKAPRQEPADIEAAAAGQSDEKRTSVDSADTAVNNVRPQPVRANTQSRDEREDYSGNALELARQQGVRMSALPSALLPSPGFAAAQGRHSISANTVFNNGNTAIMTAPVFRPASPMATKHEDAAIVEALQPGAVERLSQRMSSFLTSFIYLVILLIGIPLYYTLDFSLLLFLAVNVLTYNIAIHVVPPFARQVLHPIISGGCLTMFVLWLIGITRGLNINQVLNQYNRGDARYTDLWNPQGYHGGMPGAGDIFASVLDAGVVSLALPMFRYRKDLWANFLRIFVTCVPAGALSFFVWPILANRIGLQQVQALTFMARFLSGPFAVELSKEVDADEALVTLFVVFTGIAVAVLKDPLFRLFRLKQDSNIVLLGITVGTTGGAIGTSSLVSKPRAMAISTLTYVMLGVGMLIVCAIDPAVELIHNLTGGPVDILASVGIRG